MSARNSEQESGVVPGGRGLAVEEVELQEKRRDFKAWCDRDDCIGSSANECRSCSATGSTSKVSTADTKILIRARKVT
jgi:hypothetical protein